MRGGGVTAGERIRAAKAVLRAQMRMRLAAVDAGEARRAGERAAVHLVGSVRWRDAAVVLLYSAVHGEVDTRPMAEAAWAAGKEVCLPWPERASRALRPAVWRRTDKLSPGAFGIPVPANPLPWEASVGLVVVPGLAFDRAGGRLGSGLGFYDRWLACHPETWAIGLSHAFQLVGKVPGEAHDREVQGLLTPAGLRPVRLDRKGSVQ